VDPAEVASVAVVQVVLTPATLARVVSLAVLFAVLGALSNAAGTAFQRKAASTAPQGGGLRLLRTLARQPVWIVGIAGVVCAALFQALALVNGPIALVQPLFVLELPFALIIALPLMHRRMPHSGWRALLLVVAGLALLLISTAPHGGTDQAPMSRWLPVLCITGAAMAACVLAAMRSSSSLFRAAALGSAAAIGNAITATLLKSASGTFADHGFAAFLRSWQTYGFAVTGTLAVLLLENALQAGSLGASQPALTIGDATVSLILGVILFEEQIRLGWWMIPEACAVLLTVTGVLALARALPKVQDVPPRSGRGSSPSGS
jgi:hypothetical protein